MKAVQIDLRDQQEPSSKATPKYDKGQQHEHHVAIINERFRKNGIVDATLINRETYYEQRPQNDGDENFGTGPATISAIINAIDEHWKARDDQTEANYVELLRRVGGRLGEHGDDEKANNAEKTVHS